MKFLKMAPILFVLAMLSSFIGCMSANQHYQQTHGPKEKEMTVGMVQKEIRKGMSAADVATVLGSPNIVTMLPTIQTIVKFGFTIKFPRMCPIQKILPVPV
jgi:outer membrane protein assembly factor BamE (lipoprotein component of BamABCDE complex)